MAESIPNSVFKHAIDLNRYSNNVSKKLVTSFNRIIINATKELKGMDEEVYASSYRAKRLRKVLGTLKTSLNKWEGDSAKLLKKELQGLAGVEAEFALAQLLQRVPDADGIIREISIGGDFAQAVVESDPTELNRFLLSDRLEEKVLPTTRETFQLGAKDGATITLPNGQPLGRALRGISEASADKFRMIVQDGLLTGETTDKIVRQLIGSQGGMRFASPAVNVKQLAQAGGQLTGLANHQVMTLVRTSVTQVSNVASQKTYKANREITDKYMFVATLDSRTSLVCASKDGKEYEYDEGPFPPLHFNCRSTTVAVPNWAKLKKEYGIERPSDERTRQSADGPVPAKERYGDWLAKQDADVKKDVLGATKAKYFDQLVNKYKDRSHPGDSAIARLIRTDGTERTLAQIAATLKRTAAVKIQEPKIVIKNQKQLEKFAKAARAVQAKDLPSIAQLQLQATGAKVKPEDVTKAFDLMDEMDGLAGVNARKLRRFAEKKEVCCVWSTQREGTIIKNRSKMDHVLKNAQLKRTVERALKNEKQFSENTSRVYQTILDNAINLDEKASGPQSRLAFAYRDVKGYFTAQGKGRSRMNGFTFPGANHIVIKRKADMRPITSLKQMREDVKDAIKRAKTGKDLYWSANGEGMYKGESHWLKTYVHEMGHQVHYESGKPTLGSYDWTPSQYGSSNSAERFAETFVQYIFAPVELKKASPSAYKWVEDTLSSSLKEVETWK